MAVASAAVTVAASATLLAEPTVPSVSRGGPRDRIGVSVQVPSGGATVYVGGADVSTANGFPEVAGASVSMDLAPGRTSLTDTLNAVISGTMYLTYFTATKTETVTAIAVFTGNTAAAATPSLCRYGIYSVAGNGDLTLVASVANDTSLFAGTVTRYSRNLEASWSKVAGTRYAFGLLVVTAGAAPNIVCQNTGTGGSVVAAMFLAPRVTGSVTGQSDLPASVSNASITTSYRRMWGELVP